MYGPKPKPLKERFWSKVTKGENQACWPWQGCTNGADYGMILHEGTKVLAHRVAWELKHGTKIPDGMIVMHKCDNPRCVNPRHLELGTQRDNMEDRSDKRRDQHAAPYSRLIPKDVRTIVRRYTKGEPQEKIAEDYGISGPTVSQIIRGKIWTHVTANLILPERGRRNPRDRKLNDDAIRELRKRYSLGEHQKQLAEEFGVSKALVQQIVTGRAWAHVE